MADQTFNIALGRAAQLYKDVDDAVGGAEIVVIVLNVTGDQDAAIKDADTVQDLLALGNVAEVTNTNYARVDYTAADVSYAPDDTNDRTDLDIPDTTWSAVAAGDAWTDIVIAFDPTGASADSALVPLSLHDFEVTPDGSDITAQIAAAGFYRAA